MIETEEAYEKLLILFSPEGFVALPKNELTDSMIGNYFFLVKLFYSRFHKKWG